MYKEPKYIPGEKLIIRSNENEPPAVGHFKEWQHHPNGYHKLPIVTINGKDFLCFSIVAAYSDELLAELQKRGGKEGWFWLRDLKNQS